MHLLRFGRILPHQGACHIEFDRPVAGRYGHSEKIDHLMTKHPS
jgi:hypothetical protein